MTPATVQCGRPASYELLAGDHPATDRAMTQDYNGLPAPTTLAESGLTFTRSSPARYYDSDGKIRLVGFGEPRAIK